MVLSMTPTLMGPGPREGVTCASNTLRHGTRILPQLDQGRAPEEPGEFSKITDCRACSYALILHQQESVATAS